MNHHSTGLVEELQRDGLDGDAQHRFVSNVTGHAQAGEALNGQLSGRERALLQYALKLTHRPAEMVEGDLEPLRTVGLDDGEILDANQATAYYAYVNRLVDGLGVQLEAHRK